MFMCFTGRVLVFFDTSRRVLGHSRRLLAMSTSTILAFARHNIGVVALSKGAVLVVAAQDHVLLPLLMMKLLAWRTLRCSE